LAAPEKKFYADRFDPKRPPDSLLRPGSAEGPNKAYAQVEASFHQVDLNDIRLSMDGDVEAYRRLIERHQERVSSMMWRFSRDPETHRNLVQDVFVEAHMSLKTYRAETPFIDWLGRIATQVGYLYWKEQARKGAHPTVTFVECSQWDQASEDSTGEMDPAEASEMLYNLLNQLSPRDRLMLTLRYVEGHGVEETSRLTGWSRTMVKVQTWHARKKLKSLFSSY